MCNSNGSSQLPTPGCRPLFESVEPEALAKPLQGLQEGKHGGADLELEEQRSWRGGTGVVRNASPRRAIDLERHLWQERLDGIISVAADAIISMDTEQRILIFNKGAETIFGWTREEVLGKPLDILLPVRFRENHRSKLYTFEFDPEVSRRTEPHRPTVFGLRKDGEEFPAEAAISKLKVGGTWTFSVVLRDISERLRAEQALRESEEHLRLAGEAAGFGTFDFVFATRTYYCSPKMKEIFGMPLEREPEGPGETIRTVLPEDRDRVLEAMRAAVDPRDFGRFEVEHRVVHPDGSIRWVLARASTMFEGEGEARRPVRASGTVVDITNRKRTEEEQRFLADAARLLMGATLEYDETLKSIVRLAVRDFADCCIIDLLDADHTASRFEVVFSHPCCCKDVEPRYALNLDRRLPHLFQQALETREPMLVHEVPEGFLEAIAQSDEHLAELRALEPKSIIGVPLLVRGQLLGALGFILSRTPRRYGLGELQVARKVATLMALALDNARLHETARRAIVARDQVLGIVAHDLRGPLTSILISSELLGRRVPELGERNGRNLAAITRAATRMRRLIEDLLEVARLESGTLSIRRAPVAPEQIIAAAVEATREAASSSSTRVLVEVAPGLPHVMADHDRLLQLFDNLIGNAIKFSAPGGHIRLGGAPGDGEVLFWVGDTGPGIPAESLPHIFDWFWQADKADRRGAGLGLSIVKRIVDAHEGRIWVESTEGEGATFYFALPGVSPAEVRPHEALPALTGGQHPAETFPGNLRGPSTGKRILVTTTSGCCSCRTDTP